MSDDGKSEEKKEGQIAGIEPLVLTSQTQAIFNCTIGEGVTEENPRIFVKKEAIIGDMKKRAAISDFSPFKKTIHSYPEEELMIVYDVNYRFGQSFFICLTPEAKEFILKELEKPPEIPVVEVEEKAAETKEEPEVVLPEYAPPDSKPWVSFGSEVEVENEQVINTRAKICMKAKKFGEASQVVLGDKTASQFREMYSEIPSSEHKFKTLNRQLLDRGLQAVTSSKTSECQTVSLLPRKIWTQYEPQQYTEKQREDILHSQNLVEFLQNVENEVEEIIQLNAVADIFKDDWEGLGDEEFEFSAKQDDYMKEFQSFTYLQQGEQKMLTSIDWHPTLEGIIAASCAENCTFDLRIDKLSYHLLRPSLILIWSFIDPLVPQLLLEAPDDIMIVQFNPGKPSLLVGGCLNGQLVLWDITSYTKNLSSPNPRVWAQHATSFNMSLTDEKGIINAPVLRHCAMTNIDQGHKFGIEHLQWLPPHIEINKKGDVIKGTSSFPVQILTCGLDGSLRVWDIRRDKEDDDAAKKGEKSKAIDESSPYSFLDMTWKPLLSLKFQEDEKRRYISFASFALEVEKQLSVIEHKTDDENVFLSANYFLGSETGELLSGNWKQVKDDSGKSLPSTPVYYATVHSGPVKKVQQSPFFKDIFLTIGGWTVAIWKSNIMVGPLFLALHKTCHYTTGHWSTSRPAVFFLGCNDGTVEIWDLLVLSHQPVLVQNVAGTAITAVVPRDMTDGQVLGVSEKIGTLHILALPQMLWKTSPTELKEMEAYFDREIKRLPSIVVEPEKEVKKTDKKKKEVEKEKPEAEVTVSGSKEVMEDVPEDVYKRYLKLQRRLLKSLGLYIDDNGEDSDDEKDHLTLKEGAKFVKHAKLLVQQ